LNKKPDDPRGFDRQRLIAALEAAVADGVFIAHYQPVVEVATGRIAGVEALIRWPRAGSLVAPDVFIPIAEETGIIEPMTELLMSRAAAELGPLLRQRRTLHLAINLSARHFETDRIVHAVKACFADGEIAPASVHFEVTERGLLANRDGQTLAVMTALRARGHALALDDFGTGYADHHALDRFPFDTLKIDQSFVHEVGADAAPTDALAAIVATARARHLRIVAEGIENAAQAAAVAALGVRYGQGHHFAPPLPFAELAARLALSTPE
jgi:sensor c-di-GMP phosphodiesterase-like protein